MFDKKRILHWLQVAFALIGIGLSLYLLIQHTRVKTGIQGSASFCSLGGVVDCDVVNTSQFSEIGGLPMASLGAVFYFILLTLSLMASPKDKNFPFTQKAIGWLTLSGLAVDTALLAVQIFSVKSICLMCLGTYVATAICFAMAALMAEGEGGSRIKVLLLGPAAWGRWSGKALTVSLAAVVAFVIVVSLIPGYIVTSSQAYRMYEGAIQQFYLNWKERPRRDLQIEDGDPTWGNPNAKIRIFEFSDFECPHCRRAAFTIHTALQPFKDKVLFIFKHFPLDSTCNPKLNYELHPGSCNLARLGYCAVKQDKFWKYHDLVFLKLRDEDFRTSWANIVDLLSPVMSKEEIAKCLQDENSLQNVNSSIRLGINLDVSATPTVYIDGKQVTIPLTVDTIRKLISLSENT